MLGEKRRDEPMFYYMKIDDLIPEDHLLRLIHKHVDFSFVRERVRHLYSHTGRPSIDPELLVRMLLIGYLYGIRSERRLCEEVGMHVGYRWFAGLNLQDPVPDHSTFSRNRHERFAEGGLFQAIFDEVVARCVAHGFVDGRHLTVDATHIDADASVKSLEPVTVTMGPKEYIGTLERENPLEEEEPWEPGDDHPHRGGKLGNDTHRSKTDPEARLAKKSPSSGARLCHSVTYVMDNRTRIVVGTGIGNPDVGTDREKALEALVRMRWRHNLAPSATLGADRGYRAGWFIRDLLAAGIIPHIPVTSLHGGRHRGLYPPSRFIYREEDNSYLCPRGKRLSYTGINRRNAEHVYRGRKKDCSSCPVRGECTTNRRARTVGRSIYEDAIEKARELAGTKAYRLSQRARKKIEELFGEAKEFMGFRRARFRGRKWIAEQVLMTATAQNIKRLVKLLAREGKKAAQAARAAAGSLRTGIRFGTWSSLPGRVSKILLYPVSPPSGIMP